MARYRRVTGTIEQSCKLKGRTRNTDMRYRQLVSVMGADSYLPT